MTDTPPLDYIKATVHETIAKSIARRGLTVESDPVAIQAAIDKAATLINEALAISIPSAKKIKLVWVDKKVLIQNAD